MAQIDKEMLQDFVVEVNDNLEELEPNLLILEADPDNKSLLNDCFRNMHSIKGAAGYMGFEKISTLAHAVENLFDRMREGQIKVSPEIMNVIFNSVDRLRTLLKEVGEDGQEQSDIQDLVQQVEALQAGEQEAQEEAPADKEEAEVQLESEEEPEPLDEDQELLEIFSEEIKSLYSQLDEISRGESPSKDAVLDILGSMERVVNYVGIDELLKSIEEIRKRVEDGSGDPDQLRKIISEIGSILEKHVPGFSLAEEQAAPSLLSEDDQELYSIFVEFVRENAGPLTKIPSHPTEEWLQECEEVVSRLKGSAHYMDYPEIVAIFEEYGERLIEALSGDDPGAFDPEPLKRLWGKVQGLIPELNDIQAEIIEPPKEEDLDTVLDQLFESDETWAGFETPPDQEQTPEVLTLDEESIEEVDGKIEEFFQDGLNLLQGQDEAPPQPVDSSQQETAPPEPKPSSAPQPAKKPKKKKKVEIQAQTVRIDLENVEQLLRDVGELVVVRAGITQAADTMRELYRDWIDRRAFDAQEIRPYKELMLRMAEHATTLGRIVHNLQDGVMRMRMLPVSTLFNRYPRLVRDLAQKLNKQVELEIYGTETTLDKRLIEEMVDPLLHIIRNAVDHGIESPETREKMGKPKAGTISLGASQEGNFVVITVADDGKGLDRDAIIKRAVSLGLVRREEAQTLPDEKVWDIIFLPGISTAQQVSETSGRGVGMDVVKKNVEKVGGTIKIESSPGKGTTFHIRIPLTLAIIPALLTRVGRQVMAIPLASVQETIRVFADEISTVEGFEIISLRQRTLPLVRLAKVFRGTGSPPDPKKLFVVIIRQGDLEVGLAVDGLIGQQEVVIKPLAEYLTDQPGFSGATILGDGSIALILDIPVMLDKAKAFISRQQQVLEQSALGLEGESGLLH